MDRPIPFSAPMVRALLDGRKTQTRRVLKPQPVQNLAGMWEIDFGKAGWSQVCAGSVADDFRFRGTMPYAPGDRLWVKESLTCATEQMGSSATFADVVCYEADGTTARRDFQMVDWPWKRDTLNARYCPRWASRLTLTVTDVRVQRLQDITEADARAEGIEQGRSGRFYDPTISRGVAANFGGMHHAAHSAFQILWNSLHGTGAWDQNPWVAAISFTVQHGNIDQIGGDND